MKRIIVFSLMTFICVVLMAVSISAKSGGSQKHEGIRVEREREIEMALSAPPELRALVEERIMKSPVPFDGQGTKGLMVKDQAVILTTTNRSNMKVQAPEAVKPRGQLTSKADLINRFEESRERTISYIETTDDDLRNFMADNWVIGVMDAYQWLLFLTAHSERHIAQINEVKASANFPVI